ncbi:MAG: divalent metal cation transporter [Micrococcaceae bacterium]|nr:divalent metal cation transporter [Micrococcaceae bacterium]
MLSYAATGAQYGIGFFLPFIVVTFVAAVFAQSIALRIAIVTRRGFGELIRQRFGAFWGWTACGDLIVINLVTLVTEVIGIRIGLTFFGIPAWVAVVCTVALVTITSFSSTFTRWERIALGLAVVNLVFIPAALLSHPDPTALARAFTLWQPLPGGGTTIVLLLLASNAGATLTPWMLFFESSATTDRNQTRLRRSPSRITADSLVGGVLACAAACAVVIAAAPLYLHQVTVTGQGGAAYAQALAPLIGTPAAGLFAIGLIEAGALAMLTISASTSYVIGEQIAGNNRGFSAPVRGSLLFRVSMIVFAFIAAMVTLIPGAPLLSIVLNANVVSVALIPPALVFLFLLSSDHEVMGRWASGGVVNLIGAVLTGLIFISVVAYVGVALYESFYP